MAEADSGELKHFDIITNDAEGGPQTAEVSKKILARNFVDVLNAKAETERPERSSIDPDEFLKGKYRLSGDTYDQAKSALHQIYADFLAKRPINEGYLDPTTTESFQDDGFDELGAEARQLVSEYILLLQAAKQRILEMRRAGKSGITTPKARLKFTADPGEVILLDRVPEEAPEDATPLGQFVNRIHDGFAKEGDIDRQLEDEIVGADYLTAEDRGFLLNEIHELRESTGGKKNSRHGL